MTPTAVDQHDLQGNILAGYPFGRGVFVFVRFPGPAEGRRWLGGMVERITTAVPWGTPPASTLNVALSFDGLRALRIPEAVLETFPREFKLGMAERAERLWDVGPNAPGRWEPGLRPGEPHALVTCYAADDETLTAQREALRAEAEAAGLRVVHELATGVLEQHGRKSVVFEHFGFADGLAQPEFEASPQHDPGAKVGPYPRAGRGTPTRRGWKGLAPGEFVLGYPDEAGQVIEKPEKLFRSGSYMVVRKLQQNVALFHRYFLEAAGGDPERARWLEAKVVGRWHDGTPLVTSPDGPAAERDPNEPPENDFKYEDDPDGRRCPIGSHIRRSNPRDGLGFGGRLTSRHRIIRRGMPYGPAAEDPLVDDGRDRGLMFVCYQASIARQFELIQGRWIMDGDAFGLGADQDFLLGIDDPRGKLTIEGSPPEFVGPQRTFVINRGGGYFFVPGIAALKLVALQD